MSDTPKDIHDLAAATAKEFCTYTPQAQSTEERLIELIAAVLQSKLAEAERNVRTLDAQVTRCHQYVAEKNTELAAVTAELDALKATENELTLVLREANDNTAHYRDQLAAANKAREEAERERDDAVRQYQSEDQAHDATMRERDAAEECINKLCDAAGHQLGFDFEWTSHYGYADAVDDVETKIDDLRQRLAQAEADKERLDWLDRMNAALNKHYGTRYQWRLILSPNVVRLMRDSELCGEMAAIDLNDAEANGVPSCRQAIDAARTPSASSAGDEKGGNNETR